MTLQTNMNDLMIGLAQRLRLKPTARTGAYTAAHRDWVFANTTSAAFTVTLPASPALGDTVRVTDAGYTFDTNNLTVARNGNTIAGQAANATLRCRGQDYLFIWTGATWWPVRLSAGMALRQEFTSSGTFTPSVLLIAQGGQVLVDAAGGGASGGARGGASGATPGGGGGGGRLVLDELLTMLAASTITIGAGGAFDAPGGDTTVTHKDGTLMLRGGRPGIAGSGGASGGALAHPGGISTLVGAVANRGGPGGSSYGRGGDFDGALNVAPESGGGGHGSDGGGTVERQAGAAGIVVIKWVE